MRPENELQMMNYIDTHTRCTSTKMAKHPFRVERVYGINGKCRLYVALQSHGRSLRRCSSERTHPQRSPLGRCLGAPKWQMDFCKLPNQITRIIIAERSNLILPATAQLLAPFKISGFPGNDASAKNLVHICWKAKPPNETAK